MYQCLASSGVKEGHREGMGSFLSLLPKDRPALTGKLFRFIPNSDDGVWDCSPGSSIVYSRGSFSTRISLTAFHNSTMLIAASEYWHKVLLWFSLRLSLTLGKRKVLCCSGCLCCSKSCDAPVSYNSMLLPDYLQGDDSSAPTPLNRAHFFFALPHFPSKTKSANKCPGVRLAGMNLSLQVHSEKGTGGHCLIQDHTGSSEPSADLLTP